MLSVVFAGLSLALSTLAVRESSSNLIEDEIANTQALIELYEEKLSILNQSNTTDVRPDKTDNITLEDPNLLQYFKDIQGQQFQSDEFNKQVFPDVKRQARKAITTPYVSLANEKNYLTFEKVPEKFEWIQVRSITRSSSGH